MYLVKRVIFPSQYPLCGIVKFIKLSSICSVKTEFSVTHSNNWLVFIAEPF